MGNSFSAPDYVQTIDSFAESNKLTKANSDEVNTFFRLSQSFANVFGESTLAQYRTIKQKMPENLIFLISQACKAMYDGAVGL
jgi:hypothetical protein